MHLKSTRKLMLFACSVCVCVNFFLCHCCHFHRIQLLYACCYMICCTLSTSLANVNTDTEHFYAYNIAARTPFLHTMTYFT